MKDDAHTKIDIPESVEGYKLTLFWGLTITQVIVVFAATLFTGLFVYSLVSQRFLTSGVTFIIVGLLLLGIIEIRGRNFYRHLFFISSYYQDKPRVLLYHHQSKSGTATCPGKQLLYEGNDNRKTFIFIFIALGIGLMLLILLSIYLYHVLHS